MFSRVFASITLLLLFSVLLTTGAAAQWIEDGNPVSTASGTQSMPLVINDGEGGAFVVWTDSNLGEIFAQRLNGYGQEMWTPGGIQITPSGSNQTWPVIEQDGEGGLIVAWQDSRGSDTDIYAQRLDADGNELWTAWGVAVTTATGTQGDAEIACDGSGGAVIVWESYAGVMGATYDIYAQRIDAGGTALWTANGEPVCTESAYNQIDPDVTVDVLSNYVYFAWADYRGSGTYSDIYGHRYSLSGSRGWPVNGIVLNNATDSQRNVQLIMDRNYRFIACWRDGRNMSHYSIYAQSFDVSGNEGWTAGGVVLYGANADSAEDLDVCADPQGGFMVVWEDGRSGTNKAYAQKVEMNGTVAWTADGVLLCGTSAGCYNPAVATDGDGGAITAWQDGRYDGDIFMQRVDASGSLLWGTDGVKLTEATKLQSEIDITHDGRGGAIAAWKDYRNSNYDVYAGRMDRTGNWGFPAPEITSIIDIPGDQGGGVSVAWDASYLDAWPGYAISEYSVWRAIDQPAAMMFETNGATVLTSAGDLDSRLGTDVIRRGMLAGEPYYWQLVSYDEAYAQENYADVISTLFDSTGVHSAWHYFQVIAHTGDRTVFWESLPDSGYSVDNLAPAAPLGLAGEQLFTPNGLQLTWDPNSEADLAGYKIYRGTSETFEPGPGNFVASTPDTFSVDGYWSWDAGYWYKIAAVDIHGNESIFSVIGPDMVTGDDPMPLPDATFLAQNFPNPFNPVTTIGFGLKVSGHVSLRIYDAAGRLVTTLIDESRSAGRYTTEWKGKSADGSSAASGVYFYMLNAGEFKETKKMILLR